MTMFDASTSGQPTSQAVAVPFETGPTAEPFTPGEPAPALDSLLDQLRERVAERDEEESEPWVKEIPRVGIRLVCDPRIDAVDYQRWLKQAQSRGKGGRARPAGALDLDQFALSVRALTATCQRLEIRRGADWAPMTGRDGTVLDLDSRELLTAFNVMDAASVLRKLFGRDARVIDAGSELLTEAGYLGGDDDDNPS